MLASLLTLIPGLTEAKILIITHNYNQPNFVEMQYTTFKQFMLDDFEYVVFNDAAKEPVASQIDQMCQQYGIRCIHVPQTNRAVVPKHTFPNACTRHAQAFQFSMEALGFDHDDILMVVDSDMFLIKPFSPRSFLEGYDLAGAAWRQDPVVYLWPGLMFLRMNTLPDKKTMQFFPGKIKEKAVDTGGYFYYYLEAHPDLKVLFFQDGRMFIDRNLSVYITNPSSNGQRYQSGHPLCAECKQKNLRACSHTIAVLRERNFDKRILDSLIAKKFPANTEFMLNDTFFHYREGSGYLNRASNYYQTKYDQTKEFITMMLTTPAPSA